VKEDEIAMSDENFKKDVVRNLKAMEDSLDAIAYGFDTQRINTGNMFKPTPLEVCLDNINDSLKCIETSSSDLGCIQNSIELAGNRIEAAINRHSRAAKRMAMDGAQKSAIDDACVQAIFESRFHDVKALINSGANVHHRSGPDNRTLFSVACEVGSKQIIKLLLKNDVTTGDRDGAGKTPMDYARAACDKDVLDVLGEHGISVW
tara:strand:- start:15 stop:629 length:615 start_codon:yes stop_codon:yes gene_type:complete